MTRISRAMIEARSVASNTSSWVSTSRPTPRVPPSWACTDRLSRSWPVGIQSSDAA
jgi:hypothetical protein